MRSASVGHHCPTCVAEGSASVRQARTTFGGRVAADTSRVSMTIVAVNVVVFVLGLAVGQGELQSRFGQIAGVPGGFGVADGEYYRLLTAAFLHAGVFHVLMNMFALAQLGPVLEAALGRLRFTVLYVLSALGGSVLSYLLSDPFQLGVGASGAIFGLFGAYYVVVRRLGGETRSIVTLLAINLVITFTDPDHRLARPPRRPRRRCAGRCGVLLRAPWSAARAAAGAGLRCRRARARGGSRRADQRPRGLTTGRTLG